MSRLETERISRASAEQRQGRAGRVEPGVCYRAWSEGAQRSLAPFSPAEIVEADLTPLALELASWGVRDAAALSWLDPPPAAMLASARDLLARLEAVEAAGASRHTAARWRVSGCIRGSRTCCCARARQGPCRWPRISRRCCRSAICCAGRGSAGCRHPRAPRGAARGERVGRRRSRGPAESAARRAGAPAADRCGGRFPSPGRRGEGCGNDHPDQRHCGSGQRREQVAKRRLRRRAARARFSGPHRAPRAGGEGRYTLANGRGAHFAEPQSLSRQELIVAVDLDDREREARILLAAPLRARGSRSDDGPRASSASSRWNGTPRAGGARAAGAAAR